MHTDPALVPVAVVMLIVFMASCVHLMKGEKKQVKSSILLELARRWEEDAVTPQCQDGAEEAKIGNAIAKGERQAKRECADALKTLVHLLGEK